MATSEELTAQLDAMIAEIKGGREVTITLARNIFGGAPYARFEYPRYGQNARVLKPERAMTHVIIGEHADTLRMIATKLEEY